MAHKENVELIIDMMKQHAEMNAYTTFDENYKGIGNVMKILDEHDGPATPGDIVKISGMTGARVAVIIKKLCEKGYITREQDPKDARKVKIMLTSKGTEFNESKKREFEQLLSDVIDDVGIETFISMLDNMKKIHDSVIKIMEKEKSK